eukprot:3709219-Rhodomonas_salina.8
MGTFTGPEGGREQMESFRVTWRSSGLPAGEWRVQGNVQEGALDRKASVSHTCICALTENPAPRMLSEIGMCNTNTNMLPNQVWETAKDTVRFDEAYATLHSVLGFFGEGIGVKNVKHRDLLVEAIYDLSKPLAPVPTNSRAVSMVVRLNSTF